jgi:pyruvate/2-oxoglutarate/acetoin dehydrogenase E1 component
MSDYSNALTSAMDLLATREDTIFCGQAVAVAGTAMRNTLLNVPAEKLLELPVDEELQLGITNGLSISGFLPVSIFPRWNFLILAAGQLVNHTDKLNQLTRNLDGNKVIIRTGIGSMSPLHPGVQHIGDFTEAFKILCPNMNVVRLDHSDQVLEEYSLAATREDGVSTLLVEWGDKYA